MSQVHLHLIITHLPIFGSLLGAIVLGYGLWSKSNQTKIAAYILFIISAFGAGIAYLTGEGTEESIERLQGVSENIIELHADSAMVALVSLIILGALSFPAAFITYKNSSLVKNASIMMLVVSLISFGIVARTGYLGGQIRHIEISSNTVQDLNGVKAGDKDDD
ncbi:hypothetical protein [Arcticibacter eurypsychrophilus]|uniref:hypothetical protein n=1 Tax=Arcticibacter eurypsychrophilus TaxID=1434752 RepID=UPI00084D09BC|nr:hypothetical protein [Arcticibacter eurypsychrophilus]